MAKKPPPPPNDGLIWLGIAAAASRLGTTRRKVLDRAWAGEFRYQDDGNGIPIRVADADVAPLRTARLAAERAKAQATPRAKTTSQLKSEWAKLSASNVLKRPRGGASNDYQMRMALPYPMPKKPDEPA